MKNDLFAGLRKYPINAWLIIPFKGSKASVNHVLAYFLYESPNESSIHSSIINNNKHEMVMDKIISATSFVSKDFCKQQKSFKKKLSEACLLGNELCLKYPRFSCFQRPKHSGSEVESRLICFLKHIRNSIAHGRVYISKDSTNPYFIFEDIKDLNISARILCRKSDLEIWKTILEAEV